MGRFYIKIDSYTRKIPCDCKEDKEEETTIEIKEHKDPFKLRDDFDKDACVFWK